MLEQIDPGKVYEAANAGIRAAAGGDEARLARWVAVKDAAKDALAVRERLVTHMRCLAENLALAADRLEKNRARLPNSLGEVQLQGQSIDLLCRDLAVRHDLLRAVMQAAGVTVED
ncbi:MAG: hypothetical protein JXB47_06890 [Anaerolineae bacterium]|nr:hypothetical protein [Anaerolineae bacterium]